MSLNFGFIFRQEFDPNSDLQQGDILVRSSAIQGMLREPHSYYADAIDYSHFIVLTQSCDLVRYGTGIKSHYITIAALRPFSKFVEKITAKSDCSRPGAPVRILRSSSKLLIKQKIEQLLHYDLPGYFYVPPGVVPSIDIPLVAFLQLAISVRPEHYETIRSARMAVLQSVFSAKLGWLIGTPYSRVATPDIDAENERGATTNLIEELFNEYVDQDVFWFSDKRLSQFDQLLDKKLAEHGGELTQRDALDLASSVPPELDEVGEIISRLAGAYLPPDKAQALKTQVMNNRRLRRLVGG